MPEIPEVSAPVLMKPTVCEPINQIPVAAAIRALRVRAGLSQRQLALRMNVPRTYVSKIENEKACPTLGSLERLANALRVRVSDLLTTGHSAEDDLRELVQDDFIAELLPYLRQMSAPQWTMMLGQVRELTAVSRRAS